MASALPEDDGDRDRDVLDPVENGTFGAAATSATVYKGLDLVDDGKAVVMKKIRIPLSQGGIPSTTVREIAMVKKLGLCDHPNIVKLLDVAQGPPLRSENCIMLYLVFENVEQDLTTLMGKSDIKPETIKSIAQQVLSALDFLHTNQVVHCDLKPQNIFVSNDLKIKISDFGLAKIYNVDMKSTSEVTKLWYRAPEVLLDLPYGAAVDVWACGCIIGEMYKSTLLFDGESVAEQLDKIFKVIGLPSDLNWPKNISQSRNTFKSYPPTDLKTVIPKICSNGEDLLMKMLTFNSAERVLAYNALKHPYFNET